MLHVVNAGADVDDRPEHRMPGNIADALAVDVDLTAVADGGAVLVTRTDHVQIS